jgi:hypothetical protein
MLHTQAGYISADCFHHFRIPACSPAADHTYPGDVSFLVLPSGLRPQVESSWMAIVLLHIWTVQRPVSCRRRSSTWERRVQTSVLKAKPSARRKRGPAEPEEKNPLYRFNKHLNRLLDTMAGCLHECRFTFTVWGVDVWVVMHLHHYRRLARLQGEPW